MTLITFYVLTCQNIKLFKTFPLSCDSLEIILREKNYESFVKKQNMYSSEASKTIFHVKQAQFWFKHVANCLKLDGEITKSKSKAQ